MEQVSWWDRFRVAAVDLFTESPSLMVFNVLWLLLTLPVVTAVPAFIALFFVCHELAEGKAVGWRDFLGAFRTYFWRSFGWGGPTLVVFLLLILNYFLLPGDGTAWVAWLRLSYVVTAVFWAALHMYALPLLFEMEQPSYVGAVRRSLALWRRRPAASAGLALLLLALGFLSTFYFPVLWLFYTAGVQAYLASRAVLASRPATAE